MLQSKSVTAHSHQYAKTKAINAVHLLMVFIMDFPIQTFKKCTFTTSSGTTEYLYNSVLLLTLSLLVKQQTPAVTIRTRMLPQHLIVSQITAYSIFVTL